MKNKVKDTSTEKNVGQKPVGPESSKSSYSIYDTCTKCPMTAYISMVCDDDLSALVISGNAPEEVLQEVRSELISEFAELSGSDSMGAANNRMRVINLLKAKIQGLELCLKMSDEPEVNQFLSSLRIKTAGLKPEKARKVIQGYIKTFTVRYGEEMKKLKKITDTAVRQVKRSDFIDQSVALSNFYKFQISINISAAEFAGYVKNFKKNQNNGRNHKK